MKRIGALAGFPAPKAPSHGAGWRSAFASRSAPAAVVRLVLSRVSMLIAVGVAAGVGISIWASTFVASLLFGLAPRDPLTMSGAVALLAAVGCFAGWLPAWRASRIDPAEVLRTT